MCWFKLLWSRKKISVRRNKDMLLMRQRAPVGQRTAGTMALCCVVESRCGRESPVKGQTQAVEWDTRRVKAAKWPLCLFLAEYSIYAWKSHLCLTPVATQILGLGKWWDFVAHMVEMWVLSQKPLDRVMIPRRSLSLQFSLLNPYSPQTKSMSHFLEK